MILQFISISGDYFIIYIGKESIECVLFSVKSEILNSGFKFLRSKLMINFKNELFGQDFQTPGNM
jgi:hypothetical protein